jgi:integrase
VLGPFNGKREAKNEAAKRLRDINSGTRLPQATMTFADFWDRFFTPGVVSRRKVSTQQMYRYLGTKHLLPYFGARRLCDIDQGEVQDFINLKERQKYSTQTLRHFRNMLSKFFGAAMSRRFMAANLTSTLELPEMKKVRQSRVLTLQEISDLLGVFDQQLKTIFLFGLLPGLRIGEILGLKVQDLELESRFFHIRRNVYRGIVQDAPKTLAGDRLLPMASELVNALEDWLAIRPTGSEWVFPNDAGKPYYERNLLRRKLWPACDCLRIPRFGWHTLRHTFSTYGGNSGVPLPVLQYLLGHASVTTTAIYMHPMLEAERRAVEQIQAILLPSAPGSATDANRPKVVIH